MGFDFDSEGVDGFAIRGSHSMPIIFFNRNLPGDRRRLTIAHELGHLILHIGQTIDQDRQVEEEAFEFASEFLVPEAEFSKSFTRLDLSRLAAMKPYWSVSMGSLIVKADKLQLITKNQSRYLWAQMNKNNYVKREPAILDVAIEEPTLLKEVVDFHQSELEYSISELATMVCLSQKEFLQYFLSDRRSIFQVTRNPDPDPKQADTPRPSVLNRVL